MESATKVIGNWCKTTTLRLATVGLLCLGIEGCSLLSPPVEPRGPSAYRSSVEPGQSPGSTRRTTSIENGIGLLGKTVVVDPLVRPYTTLKALYGYTMKSFGGFVERAFINQVRLRRLQRREIPPVADRGGMDLSLWERELDALTGRPASRGSIRLLIDGEVYFDRLDDAIAGASRSIDIRTYIFDNDDFSVEIGTRLRERAEEVDVRVMVDGLANVFAPRIDSKSMPEDAVLPASMGRYLAYASPLKFRRQSNPWLTGDHAKVTLIDAEIAFVGGMNIGREYRYDWHDLMLEIQGPVVDELQRDFDRTWARAGVFGDYAVFAPRQGRSHGEQAAGGYPVRILETSIHNSELYRAQVAAIRRARGYIYIQNAYFADDKILFELIRARRRGVDVRVILSAGNDSKVLGLSNQKAINTMLRNGIRVFAYPGMTHVKAAIYDGWVCVGSANFDKLSLQVNREINLGTSHPAVARALLEQLFEPDFVASREISRPLPLGPRHHFAELVADEFL